MSEIPTIQPFQSSAALPRPSPPPPAVQNTRKSSTISARDTEKIFENRDLLFSILSEDIDVLSHPQPTFITPLHSYLKLDYRASDIIALSAMVDGESNGSRANIQQLYQEKAQKHRNIETHLREEYLV
jgi:hypothetical protein